MSYSEPETRSSFAPPLSLMHELRGHRSGVRMLASSPDGKWFASADLGRRIALWKGAELHLEFDPLPFWERFPSSRRIHALAFSLDSSQLFVAMTDRICAYDVSTGRRLWRYRPRRVLAFLANAPVGLSVNPASGMLTASFEDGHIVFWPHGEQGQETWFDNDAPRYFGFSRDGSRMVGTDGHSICIWDMATHAKLAKKVPSDRIYALAVSQTADVAAVRTLYAISIWNLESGHELGRIGMGSGLPLIAFSSSENLLAYSERGKVMVADFEGNPRGAVSTHDAQVLSLCFRQDGLLVGCSDGMIRQFGTPQPQR